MNSQGRRKQRRSVVRLVRAILEDRGIEPLGEIEVTDIDVHNSKWKGVKVMTVAGLWGGRVCINFGKSLRKPYIIAGSLGGIRTERRIT